MKNRVCRILVYMLIIGTICGCSLKEKDSDTKKLAKEKQTVSKIELEEEKSKVELEEEPEEPKKETPVEKPEETPQTPQTTTPTPNTEIKDPNNTAGLSTERFAFSFGAAKNGQPHSITVNNQAKFDSYNVNALAWDNKTQGKVLYLTFDCGYKYGNLTERILDTLKSKNVKAAFFGTLSFFKEDPALVQRMIDEGHIVGNHSVTHPDCTTISRTQLAQELKGVDDYLRSKHGITTKYFRFPTGAYSQNALDLVNSQGYRSVFWSIAHADWDPQNQPGIQKSFQTVTERLHPGAVILLHSTSPDNADILADYIDYARNQGYEFKTLDEYPNWN